MSWCSQCSEVPGRHGLKNRHETWGGRGPEGPLGQKNELSDNFFDRLWGSERRNRFLLISLFFRSIFDLLNFNLWDQESNRNR